MIGSSTPAIDRADPYEAVVDTCYEDLLLLAGSNSTGPGCDSVRFTVSRILNDTDYEDKAVNGTQLGIESDGLNNWWAMLALVLVLGTAAGNILVCLAIARERKLQNVTNYFLMSLAITDLMVAVLVMPLGILILVRGEFHPTSGIESLRVVIEVKMNFKVLGILKYLKWKPSGVVFELC